MLQTSQDTPRIPARYPLVSRLQGVSCYLVFIVSTIALLHLIAPTVLAAQEVPESPRLTLELSPLGFEQRFKTDIDGGGDVEQRRAFGGLQLRLQPSDRWQLSFNTSYAYHQFRFSGSSGFGQLNPWEHVNLFSFSAPLTFQASDRWQLSLIPFLQLNKESDADVGESITGGGIVTAVYRFSDRFHLGLGVGGENRLEDDGAIFLFPIIEWHITDTLRLIANIRDPFPVYALELQADLGTAWTASLGIEAREDRFRLDDNGTASKGVGESNQATLRASLSYRFRPGLRLAVYGGAGFGEIRLEDMNGDNVRDADIDPTPVLGITLTASF